jgi:hypothetical protein
MKMIDRSVQIASIFVGKDRRKNTLMEAKLTGIQLLLNRRPPGKKCTRVKDNVEWIRRLASNYLRFSKPCFHRFSIRKALKIAVSGGQSRFLLIAP